MFTTHPSSLPALPPPQVTITPSGSSTAGSPYSLTCTVMVVNGLIVVPQVMWLYNGASAVGGNGVSLTSGMVSTNTTTLTLQFNPLNTSNEGQYSCIANVSIPTISIASLYSTSSTSNATVQSKFSCGHVHVTIDLILCQSQSLHPLWPSWLSLDRWYLLGAMSPWPVISNWTHQWTVMSQWTVHGLDQPLSPLAPYWLALHIRTHWCWVHWPPQLQATTPVQCWSPQSTLSSYLKLHREQQLLVKHLNYFSITIHPSSLSVSVHTINITTSGSPVAGQMYTLTCTGTLQGNNLVIPVVTWSNSAGVVISGNGITVSNGNLTFNPLHTSHGGQYTCQSTLSTFNSNVISSTQLNVQGN